MVRTRRAFLRSVGTAAGVAGVAGSTAMAAPSAGQFTLGEVVHTTVTLNVRDGPGTGNAVVDTEPPAMRGTVKDGPVAADGFDWFLVEFDDDRHEGEATGWCATEGTWLRSGYEFDFEFCIYDAVHATDWVNVRDGPGTSAADIGTAAPGDTGNVLAGPAQADGFTWWNVEFHDDADGWVAANWLEEGMLHGCNAAWDTADNRFALGKVITSEASVGTTAERRAVGYSVLNRMARNGTTEVTDEWNAYAHNQDPTAEIRDMATGILRCQEPDDSCGATHFYSPRSMPKEGEDTTGFDTGGGLEWTPGLAERNWVPSWAETYFRSYVVGARQAFFKFYRLPGNGFV